MRQGLDRVSGRRAAVCHRAALGDKDDLARRRCQRGQRSLAVEHLAVEVDRERGIGRIVRMHFIVIRQKCGVVIGKRRRIVDERELQLRGNAADDLGQNDRGALMRRAVVDCRNHSCEIDLGF